MSINLSTQTKLMAAELNRTGFPMRGDQRRRIRMRATAGGMSEDDRAMLTAPADEGGEMTTAEFDARLRDYASLAVDVDLYSIMPDDHPYLEMDLIYADIEARFWSDFNRWIKEHVGDGVKITFHEGACEYERTEAAASV